MSATNMRRIARGALLMFAMAWINLAVQAPLHAAMKQQDHSPCHCKVELCDLVLSMQQQADDALGFAGFDIAGFQVAFFTTLAVNPVRYVADIQYHRHILDYRESSPPPLLLKTTLLI